MRVVGVGRHRLYPLRGGGDGREGAREGVGGGVGVAVLLVGVTVAVAVAAAVVLVAVAVVAVVYFSGVSYSSEATNIHLAPGM